MTKCQLKYLVCGLGCLFISSFGAAHAAVLAIENFDYSGTVLSNQNGGTGWAGAWVGPATLSGDNTSLLFKGITPIGARVDNTFPSASSTRLLSTAINLGQAGTYYTSMLITKSDTASMDISFSDGTNDRWRMRWSSAEVISFGISSVTQIAVSTNSFANTLLVVMKLVSTTGADTLSIKIFKPGDTVSEPITWDATDTQTSGVILDRFKIGGSVAGGQIDAIRIGTTFQDVAAVASGLRLVVITNQ